MFPEVSVIIIYNNLDILNSYALKGLNTQRDVSFEKILVNNCNQEFINISDALNYAVSLSKTDYLIILHQDFEFLNNLALFSLKSKLLDADCIVGVAGITDKKLIVTNITHGKEKKLAGDKRIANITLVETVDECCFGLRKSTYLNNRLNPKIIFDWHLYATFLSITSKINYEIKTYTVPTEAYHYSTGNINKTYNNQFSYLLKYFKFTYKFIYTTCQIGYTNPTYHFFYRFFFVSFNKLLQKIRVCLMLR